jgi:alkylation response protein AidB-like acyl-CoA dehydrogenase
VRVEESELLLDPGPLSTPFTCLRPLLSQLIFAHMFLGIGEGMFAEMKRYTLHESRPWFKSPAQQASKDPHTLRHYGEFFIGLESVRLLLQQATTLFDEAWARGPALDEQTRGRVAIAIAAAKVAATRVGLELSSDLFDVAGARATHGALRLDRFWRNLRTQTLHDPVDYKLQELGDWAVNDELPEPSFYS